MLERYGFYVLAFGAVLAAAAFLWLIVRAFRVGVGWGVAVLLFPPAAIVFVARHFRRAKLPLELFCLACVLIAAPYAASYYERHFIPLAPYEQIVDGELRVTLTGLKDFDYDAYAWRRDIVVLQMANPDVDDRTLEHVKQLPKLRNLDVSDTHITDAGLATIAALPTLEELRLARTAVTDAGFQEHLAAKDSLLKLDLTGIEIKGKTKREWKNKKPDVREYVD